MFPGRSNPVTLDKANGAATNGSFHWLCGLLKNFPWQLVSLGRIHTTSTAVSAPVADVGILSNGAVAPTDDPPVGAQGREAEMTRCDALDVS